MMCLDTTFFGFFLFWIFSAFWICRFMSLASVGPPSEPQQRGIREDEMGSRTFKSTWGWCPTPPQTVSVEASNPRILGFHPHQAVTDLPPRVGWCQMRLMGSWSLHCNSAATESPACSPAPCLFHHSVTGRVSHIVLIASVSPSFLSPKTQALDLLSCPWGSGTFYSLFSFLFGSSNS